MASSGTRTSNRSRWPSGFTNARTSTVAGISCAGAGAGRVQSVPAASAAAIRNRHPVFRISANQYTIPARHSIRVDGTRRGSMKPQRFLILGGTFAVALVVALGAQRSTSQQAAQAPMFEVDPLWPKPMPNHWLLGSTTGLAIDSRDHVFVVHLTDSFVARTEIGATANPPIGECCAPAPNVLEFDPDGNLVGHWGGPADGVPWPAQNHGIAIDPQGNIWIGSGGPADSQLLKFSRDGRFLMVAGKATPPASAAAPAGGRGDTAYAGVSPPRGGGAGGRGGRGAAPPPLPANSGSTESFGGPADISFDAAANEAFIADGLRNHRVAVINLATGAIKRFWGAYGTKPDDAAVTAYTPGGPASKQFGVVRCAEPARDGLLYVCDRTNNRIQVFRKNGTFVKEKVIAPKTGGAGAVWDIAFSRDPQQRFLYVADGQNMKVRILDRQTLNELTTFGDGGRQPGQFYAVHSIATDSKGNIYTAESLQGKRIQKFVFKGIGPVRT